MRMGSSLLRMGLCAGALLASSAGAQDADLVGRTHEGDLKIPGWEDRGGGQLVDSVWYSVFRRSDGAFRVVINRSLGYRPGSQFMSFRVTDVVATDPYPQEIDILFVCKSSRVAKPGTLIAAVRIDIKDEKEWWTDVRRAWTISVQTGRLTETETRGVQCLNEAWGR